MTTPPNERNGSTAGAASLAAERLSCLFEVAQVINSSLELDEVLNQILTQARQILGSESGSIMLLEEPSRPGESRTRRRASGSQPGGLQVVAAQGPRAINIRGRSQSIDSGVAGWVVRHGKPRLLRGSTTDPEFNRVCDRQDVRDALCVPLSAEGNVIGVISLNNHVDNGGFSEDDLDLLTALAHQAALAIRNARSFEEACRQRRTVERLLIEITRAQEEERKRIALFLHDGPAQTMFAALRDVQTARALAAQNPERAAEVMNSLEETVRQAISETRAVMLDLRPLTLDEIGLRSALPQYAEQFQKRTGIKTKFVQAGPDRRLPSMIESCLYRITQEALTNVWKHAEAKSAQIVLEVNDSLCTLEIVDDGRGIDTEAAEAAQGEHLGLSTLRDRAELIGGFLTVAARPGGGTVVRVSTPISS